MGCYLAAVPLLRKAGFTDKFAKGSHTKWKHPKLPKAIIFSGKDGDDAKLYLEKQVNDALETLRRINTEDADR